MEAKEPSQGGVYESVLDLFSIGIGPSSSHTVGPMRAAERFRNQLSTLGVLEATHSIHCDLYGSLAATGLGHGTPDAVLAGLRGAKPESVDPNSVHGVWESVLRGQSVKVGDAVLNSESIRFYPWRVEHGHPNVLSFRASTPIGPVEATFLSVGGGFIQQIGDDVRPALPPPVSTYRTTAELMSELDGRTLAELAWEDECAGHGTEAASNGIRAIWGTMRQCLERGLHTEGVLPGPLQVPRRAAKLYRKLKVQAGSNVGEQVLPILALAVSEENAAGGRIVTAPTNGAAGVLPAVLFYANQQAELSEKEIRDFLLTAAVIGSLIKANASISGAEAGCQAEVGSACAMAAAGLTAVRGGSPAQVENAAEIAIEHHLGLTCDPVGGLVQIPCIERNAVAAATSLTASRLALLGDGSHIVGLDTAIETMRQTGMDMSQRYKETSAAGLAVNVVEC